MENIPNRKALINKRYYLWALLDRARKTRNYQLIRSSKRQLLSLEIEIKEYDADQKIS